MTRSRVRSQAICRRIVFARDKGVCALCHVDTEGVRVELKAMQEAMNPEEFVQFRAAWLTALGFPLANKSLWRADHYPIPFGFEGSDALTNLRTLCVRCDKAHTGSQAGMMAKVARLKANPLLKTMGKR